MSRFGGILDRVPHALTRALADDRFLGSQLATATWRPWRTILRAACGEPLDADELALFQRLTGRTRAPTAACKELWVIAGRRSGKSRVAALLAVFVAAFLDHRPKLAPGERATVALVAADRAQARTLFRYVGGLVDTVPIVGSLVAKRTSSAIELVNRSVIEVTTANHRTSRGYSFAAAAPSRSRPQ